MVDSIMIVIDNSEYSQNQDYLPNRFILQKETLTEIFNSTFSHPDNTVGLVPICQNIENLIQTPTSDRFQMESFVSKLKLSSKFKLHEVLEKCCIGLSKRLEFENKKLWIFYGCDYDKKEFDEMFVVLQDAIEKIASKDIAISFVLFGEKRDTLAELLKVCFCEYIENVAVIGEDDDFITKSLECFGIASNVEMDDPELAMALKLSLEEAKRNEISK